MLQKEIKDLTFEVSDPSTCLQFLLFLHDRSIVHFHNWGGGGGGGVHGREPLVDVIIV